MSAIVHSQRGRVGTILVATGALLLAFSMIMVFTGTPAAYAANDFPLCHADPPNPGTPPPVYNGTEFVAQAAGIAGHAGGGEAPTNEGHTWDIIPGYYNPYFDKVMTYEDALICGDATVATTTTTAAVTTTTAAVTTTTVADTTTTTVADTTTTTVGGPGEPTTTTSGDTTTTTFGGTTTSVLGPEDPELPNNGAGELLAVFLGGLGLLFMGSGSLVIASERKRLIGA
jgi:hypothetical protein